jgi:hypothetical protein
MEADGFLPIGMHKGLLALTGLVALEGLTGLLALTELLALTGLLALGVRALCVRTAGLLALAEAESRD